MTGAAAQPPTGSSGDAPIPSDRSGSAAPGQDGAGEHQRLDGRLAIVALACWATTAVGVWAGTGAAVGIAVGAGIGGLLVVVLGASSRGRTPVVRAAVWATAAAVLFTVCGFSVAAAVRVHSVDTAGARAVYGRTVHAEMTVDGDPHPIAASGFGGGHRVLVRGTLQSMRRHGRDVPVSGAVVAFAPASGWEDLAPGQSVRFRGRFAPPTRRDLTVATIQVGGPPSQVGPISRIQQIAGAIRDRFADICRSVLAPSEAGLLRGLVLGDVAGMPDGIADDFRTAGLTHLTAVSGSNFALVCGLVLLLARPLGPRPAAIVTAAAIVGFVILVRPSPSVLRAASMGVIGLAALLTGRRRQALPALAAAVLVLLAWRPALAVDPGFAMSALATAALVVMVPPCVDWLRARGWPRLPAEAVAVAGAAHMVTMPIVAAISGSLSLVAVPANLLAAPAVAPATILGALGAALGPAWGYGAGLLVRCTGPPLWWLVHVARWCAELPGAALAVPGGPAGAVLMLVAIVGVCGWYASRRFRWCVVAATVAAAAVWLPTHWTGRLW